MNKNTSLPIIKIDVQNGNQKPFATSRPGFSPQMSARKKAPVLAQTEKKKTIRIEKEIPPPPTVESDSIAVRFFSKHPEANVDPRPLNEKINDIDILFKENKIDDENLFELLVQKNAMCDILYGENSVESIIASTQLGAFYNKIGRHDSAYRHLQNAYIKSTTIKIAQLDQMFLSVEYVQSLFEIGFNNNHKSDSTDINSNSSNNGNSFKSNSHFEIMDDDILSVAENALFPFKDVENDDKIDIVYRRDLYIAQMKLCRRKFSKALKFYRRAIDTFQKMEKGENDGELGALHLNAALCAHEIKERDVEKENLEIARNIFVEIGLTAKVQEVDGYINSLINETEKEEEDEGNA